MKFVLALVLLGLAVILIDAGRPRRPGDTTLDERLVEETQESDVEKRKVSAKDVLAAATAASRVYNTFGKDGIKLIWDAQGMGRIPFSHEIYFVLNNQGYWQSPLLQDGDKIKIIRGQQDKYGDKAVEITLNTPASTWWKALTVQSSENKFMFEIVYTQDATRKYSATVPYRDLLENFIGLSKAKAFGIHTNMYWIRNSYDLSPDYKWEIIWQKD